MYCNLLVNHGVRLSVSCFFIGDHLLVIGYVFLSTPIGSPTCTNISCYTCQRQCIINACAVRKIIYTHRYKQKYM